MAIATFDTLHLFQQLKAGGFQEEQAQALTKGLADAFTVNLKELATKDDLRMAEDRLGAKIDLLRADNQGQFKLLNWMAAAAITLGVAIAVRLFFFPIR